MPQNDEVAALQVIALDDLYALLVPNSDQIAYSKEGRVVRGKQLFERVFQQSRNLLCATYRENEAIQNDALQLTTILATALLGSPSLFGVPALPMAALSVRLGMKELCAR